MAPWKDRCVNCSGQTITVPDVPPTTIPWITPTWGGPYYETTPQITCEADKITIKGQLEQNLAKHNK